MKKSNLQKSLRNFTINFGTQHPAADKVLNYVYKNFSSEVSACLIDLCPVGGKDDQALWQIPENMLKLLKPYFSMGKKGKIGKKDLKAQGHSSIRAAYRLLVKASPLQACPAHLRGRKGHAMRLSILDSLLRLVPSGHASNALRAGLGLLKQEIHLHGPGLAQQSQPLLQKIKIKFKNACTNSISLQLKDISEKS